MKKGFTLIELLAVIVILAIIALIATPIVLNIIKETKESAQLRSVELYASAVENGILVHQLKPGNEVPSGKYISSNGGKTLIKDGVTIKVDYDGDVICDEVQIYEDGTIYLAQCEVNKTPVDYTYGEKQLVPGVYDENGTLTYSWEELIDLDYIRIENNILYTDNVIMGWGAEEDGYNAFDSDLGNGKFVIDNSIETLSYSIFVGTRFSEIILPDNLKIIEDSVFEDSGIESIKIPNSVEKIGAAFLYVSSSSPININYLGTKEEWNGIEFTSEEYLGNYTDITVHCTDGDIVVPANQ